MSEKLSDRVRPDVEAARWVVDEIKVLERELAGAREDAVNQRRLAELALAHRDALIEERDTLEEALQEILERNDYGSSYIAQHALATVKGGQHDQA